MAVALAVPLDARGQAHDGRRVVAVMHTLDQAAQIADQVAAEARSRAVMPLCQRAGFADQVRQATLAARMIAIGAVPVGDQPSQEGVADQCCQFAALAAADTIDDRGCRHRNPEPQQSCLLIPGGFVEMHDLGHTHLFDQLLDHRFACQAEFVNAPFDGGNTEFNAQPVDQKFGDLHAREAETQRQGRDEGSEHRANQAALAHLQVAPAPLDMRAQPGCGTCDGLLTTVAAYRQIAMFRGRDVKVHLAAGEFQTEMGADVAALRGGGPEARMACVARIRNMQDFVTEP